LRVRGKEEKKEEERYRKLVISLLEIHAKTTS
jgi:hypothetical protein